MFIKKLILISCITTSLFVVSMEQENNTALQFFYGNSAIIAKDVISNHLFDSQQWYLERQINTQPEEYINSLCFSPVGDSLAFGKSKHSQGSVYVQDLTNNEQVIFPEYGRSIAISKSGKYLVIGNQKTLLFDKEKQEKVLWDINNGFANSIAFDPQEQCMAIVINNDIGDSIEILSTKPRSKKRNKTKYIKTFYHGCPTSVSFNPAGTCLATANSEGEVRIIEMGTLQEIKKYSYKERVKKITYSPCGIYLAAALKDRVLLINTTTDEESLLFTCNEHKSIESINFHPSGDYLAIGASIKNYADSDVDIDIVSIQTKKSVFSHSETGLNDISDISFNSLGNRFAIGLWHKILLYNNEQTSINQIMLRKLCYLWLQVKRQDKSIVAIDSFLEQQKNDVTITQEKRITLLLQKIAEEFCCNFSELQTIWNTCSLPLQQSMQNTFNKIIDFHKQTQATSEQQLFSALKKQDTFTIYILLNRGVDVNSQEPQNEDYSQSTLLHYATEYLKNIPEGLNIIKILIQQGAFINASNEYNTTPLKYALCYHPWEDAALIFLDNFANVYEEEFHSAAENGFVKAVGKILSLRPYFLNATDKFNNSALILACSKNHPEVVRLLLEKGARRDICNKLGYTAFTMADFHHDKKCLNLLHKTEPV